MRYDLGDLTGAATDWKAACAQYDVIKSTTGNHKFMMACCHAGLAGLAGRPGSGVSAAERANQAEEAMAILRQAFTIGYREADAYRNETALGPLRKRPDFQLPMLDVVMPAAPFAR